MISMTNDNYYTFHQLGLYWVCSLRHQFCGGVQETRKS